MYFGEKKLVALDLNLGLHRLGGGGGANYLYMT